MLNYRCRLGLVMIKILNKQHISHRIGWDVTINKESTDKTRQENMVFFWPGKDEPDEKILEAKFEYFQKQYDDEVAAVPEKVYTETEVVKELITKKYLVEGQKFADLPVKSLSVGGK